jgi:TonB family protein
VTLLGAQQPETMRIGPGVKTPRLLHKGEPSYTPEALKQQIQGIVQLELVVDEHGSPVDIVVVSPLGFGLDEAAHAAVAKWRFEPGTKNGEPVRVIAVVDVTFRLTGLQFDAKTEEMRVSYNGAINGLARAQDKGRAVKAISDLAHRQYPPAMHMLGVWEMSGEHVDKNPADGLALMQKSAAKNYGPALFEIAVREIEGRDVPQDLNRGIDTMKRAATLGSYQAQYNLGQRYEKGTDVAVDVERSRRYFRLCAAHGIEMCQYRLGASMVNAANRSERDYVQGLAWLGLAADNKVREAAEIVDPELTKLTGPQLAAVKSMQGHLLQK